METRYKGGICYGRNLLIYKIQSLISYIGHESDDLLSGTCHTSLHQPLLGIVASVELEGEDVLHELVDVPRLGHDLEVLPVIETAVVEGDQEVAGYVGVRLLWNGLDIQIKLRILSTVYCKLSLK